MPTSIEVCKSSTSFSSSTRMSFLRVTHGVWENGRVTEEVGLVPWGVEEDKESVFDC